MKLQKIKRYVWQQIDTSGGPESCWPWNGTNDEQGYPVLRLGTHQQRVAQLVYLWERGEDPGLRAVRHICGNRSCLNPAHLWPGTSVEIIRERLAEDLPTEPPAVAALRLLLEHRAQEKERSPHVDPGG